MKHDPNAVFQKSPAHLPTNDARVKQMDKVTSERTVALLGIGNANDGTTSSLAQRNSGNANVTISGVNATAAGFSLSGASARTTLAPNQTTTRIVAFDRQCQERSPARWPLQATLRILWPQFRSPARVLHPHRWRFPRLPAPRLKLWGTASTAELRRDRTRSLHLHHSPEPHTRTRPCSPVRTLRTTAQQPR